MSNENFKESNNGVGPQSGKYKDAANEKPLEQRTPAPSLPKAPDPSPFSFGNGGGK